MTISFHPYHGEEDYHRVSDFLIRHHLPNSEEQ